MGHLASYLHDFSERRDLGGRTAKRLFATMVTALEAADPFGELVNALEQDASNTNAYVRILRLCADNARSITDINAAMGDSALDAVALVGKLEDVEAIEWRGGWATTDLGMRYLDRVA